ncbi:MULTISPECIES: tRNA uridine-5-carboxymethylaminomethyl(34) synthesis GTPase MnmE [Bartonella]|uniref:tRNA uridine-5-carboxymethylaminomethyl(34) synthesis GTPase MnmE n=1 Tax=Bartonella TaxID=773 RepID=UPI0018DD135C|nr:MULTISPECIES: tRNA uridine-5-carboxymethylaminomethyl(34) synthesis GTPase MnmE [Bartonella]MBH9974850.1 tRNA uridine-5-carboxymethylaminomethyl(34) synthesis GTPase MnmE [Bartonella choladocola]MBI0014456.1 tRNA uridine-5-carboxymethylaminomethyl(34) synthesis GTPase MnmE [Bartonella sp. B10834G3]
MDTIFALSSGKLPSGVAVIRVSGDMTRAIVKTLLGKIPAPRVMSYGKLVAQDGDFLDSALTVFFPSPHSFTGEDCAEFHLHGGKAVIDRFLNELAKFDSCRLAEPGEFSRRAFFNGKLDLTEAEGLADLIEAETESQRRLAIMGASGELATLYRQWRSDLIKARAMIEAELDFSDEEDVPGSVSDIVWDHLQNLSRSISEFIIKSERVASMRDGIKIVIAGAPNAGKSSIINKLAGFNVAIVTDEAGTTRDALETRIVIDGYPVLMTDTAGLRETDNKVEKLGIEVAYDRVKDADLVLLVDDLAHPVPIKLPETDAEIWHIGNKSDLANGSIRKWPIRFSTKTGEGFDAFVKAIASFCSRFSYDVGEVVTARKRQLALLKIAVSEIDNAVQHSNLDLSLRAEHLRLAADSLGRITGDIDVEDILDVIFSQFCIGK